MIDFGQRESGEVAKMSPNEFIRKALQEAGEDVLREEIEAGEVDGENKPIETFENGQPVAPAEQEVPQVKVEEPEVAADHDLAAETSPGEEAPAVPEEVAKADEQIEEVVEGELQAEGADAGEIEAEVGKKTELPVGQDAVALSHETFTRAKGEADADTAASLEARIVGGEPSGQNGEHSEDRNSPTEIDREDAPTGQILEQKVEQPVPSGEIKIVEKEIIGKATIEIPSGEEWHVDVVGKSTITINNNAKLVVSDVAGKNKFIIIGNGQLEIKGVDDKNEIVRK
ncbi:MAG: hypothetical protein PHH45_01470 [Patescibacteria group bacterium]|jgi:hypothetical protein|nr:hypothetical protein [Patescibacteria group bacterium]